MENKDDEKLLEGGSGTDEEKNRYVVLFARTLKQWEVSEAIRRKLPEDRGTVFYPCVERWIRSLGHTVVQPLFPGYVFIRSPLPRSEIHEYIRHSRREVFSFIKELRISRDRLAAEEDFAEEFTDLTDAETELLDFMLGFRFEKESGRDGHIETDGEKTETGKKIYRKKLPQAGVLGMSRGYKDSDGRYVVMEGPLAGHGDKIMDVDARDRVAWLNLKVGGRLAKVGLELDSKKRWVPKDRNAPVVLDDGFVLNPKDVAAEIMRPKK